MFTYHDLICTVGKSIFYVMQARLPLLPATIYNSSTLILFYLNRTNRLLQTPIYSTFHVKVVAGNLTYCGYLLPMPDVKPQCTNVHRHSQQMLWLVIARFAIVINVMLPRFILLHTSVLLVL